MRAWRRRVVRSLLGRDLLWRALPSGMRHLTYLRIQRAAVLAERFAARRAAVFADTRVRSGPFEGLRYPAVAAVGSAAYPKIVGSYEAELHAEFEALLRRQPPLVVDIGCAEGYYLVGLARRLPEARLVGYDPHPEAHAACRALAQANGLPPGRLELHGAATLDSLRACLPARGLVICDCEGCEADLFTAENLALWAQSDLVIECHDFLQPGIFATLSRRLATTHTIVSVATVEAQAKLSFVAAAEFAAFRPEEKLELLAEGRPAPMQWIVARARPSA